MHSFLAAGFAADHGGAHRRGGAARSGGPAAGRREAAARCGSVRPGKAATTPRRLRHLTAALLAGALALGGCRAVGPPLPPEPSPAEGWTQTGTASWYGEPFHGRTTASGEIYDMEAMTAAHRTLPFGTVLRVDNLDNGRTTTLRINDRGPFVGNRILDVSRRGARELEMIGPGTARVRITVIEAPAPRRCWDVQVGSFSVEANALAMRDRLLARGEPARVEPAPGGMHRVRLGPYEEHRDADAAARRHDGVVMGC
jgi:rare lipoprotein A